MLFCVLETQTGMTYTGKAGNDWVSSDRDEAWTFASKDYATQKAALFNERQRLHGLTFRVVEMEG